MLPFLLAAAVAMPLQQPPAARLVLDKKVYEVRSGDTVRINARVLDANGKDVPNAKFVYVTVPDETEHTGPWVAGWAGTQMLMVVGLVPGQAPLEPAQAALRILPAPPSRVELNGVPDRMVVGQGATVTTAVYTATGDRREDEPRFTTSSASIATVDASGRVAAVGPGTATITATAGTARATRTLVVVPNTIRAVSITGGAAHTRTGDVVRFGATARDASGKLVPGLAPKWTLSPGEGLLDADGSFVAYEAGTYTLTATVGNVSSDVVVKVAPRDVRRATTTLGRLPISKNLVAEFWPHPNGKNAYLTTIGDKVYALDIADPANPSITDSITADARVINDFMSTPDGKFGVFTREGASTRRNGIVVVSLEDPAHPKPISEYTETVTGGVHSTFIYAQPKFGTHVYLTDDATGSMRVIDLNDPKAPKEVARWQTERPTGRTLHDLEVKNGLAYLSYWDDGLVVLDVGNGVKGGTPTKPMLVSQFRYDLDSLYKTVEREGGAGFIRGTHTAWRSGKYVFVGDEVFSAKPQGVKLPGLGLGKANGRLHVIDVSDMSKPREVAYYEPQDGGAHNVWVAGDTLYLGDYQGGLRILDISGELRGDLLKQGREIAKVHTGDAKGMVPNAAMTWGAFHHNGLVFANDAFSGLWIVRVEPRETKAIVP